MERKQVTKHDILLHCAFSIYQTVTFVSQKQRAHRKLKLTATFHIFLGICSCLWIHIFSCQHSAPVATIPQVCLRQNASRLCVCVRVNLHHNDVSDRDSCSRSALVFHRIQNPSKGFFAKYQSKVWIHSLLLLFTTKVLYIYIQGSRLGNHHVAQMSCHFCCT